MSLLELGSKHNPRFVFLRESLRYFTSATRPKDVIRRQHGPAVWHVAVTLPHFSSGESQPSRRWRRHIAHQASALLALVMNSVLPSG